MRDLFQEWESVEGEKVTLESLGDMEQLIEVREETELVENEMTESVENFKVSLAKLDELCTHTDVCMRERERERERFVFMTLSLPQQSFEAQCSQLLEDTLKVYEMQAETKYVIIHSNKSLTIACCSMLPSDK